MGLIGFPIWSQLIHDIYQILTTEKEGFVYQENLWTCNYSWRAFLSLTLDSYFTLLELSFVENYHMSNFTTFAKQSMINRLSNPFNRNRSAAKISKVMSSTVNPNTNESPTSDPYLGQLEPFFYHKYCNTNSRLFFDFRTMNKRPSWAASNFQIIIQGAKENFSL